MSEMTFQRIETVPFLTTRQMIDVDRAMVEDLGVDLLLMMETAGRNLAHRGRARFLEGSPEGRHVVVLAGRGGNGGGAMVCARRLHTWGARVHVHLAAESGSLTPATARQRDILGRMGVAVEVGKTVRIAPDVALIVDGVIGYRLSGAPRGGGRGDRVGRRPRRPGARAGRTLGRGRHDG